MTLYERLRKAGPTGKIIAPIIDEIIAAVNISLEASAGTNPHKVNDVTNVIAHAAANDIDTIVDLAQELIDDYEAHIGSTTHHIGADSTNVVTELGVAKEVYTLLDELKTDYAAHRVLTGGSVHAGTDAVNVVTAANATTKATAFALANDLSTKFQANFVNVTTHHGGSGDTAGAAAVLALGVLTSTSTWSEIAAVADGLRTAYEAHRVLTAGSVHGGADATNTVTATAVGTFATAVYAGINELKTDFNAHIDETGSYHKVRDNSMTVSAAAASTTATARTLVNALRVAYMDHITRADEPSTGIALLSARSV